MSLGSSVHRLRGGALASASRGQAGFSMIEVLVTMVIMAIGLLGVAGLQMTGLKNNQSAYHRSQAYIQASQIMELMRANRDVAVNGGYDLAMSASAPTGTSTVNQDLANWLEAVQDALPSGDASVAFDAATDLVTVTVQWNEDRLERVNGNVDFVLRSQL